MKNLMSCAKVSIDSGLYPKNRPPLTDKHRAVYVEEYAMNRSGRGFYAAVQFMESWMHRQVGKKTGYGEVLELGAGSLNHLAFENGLDRYDVCEPLYELCEKSKKRWQINTVIPGYDVLKTLIGNTTYDRIFSIAVLEHLEDLLGVVAQSGLLLKDSGIFQAGVPSEGGFLWGLSWRLTTGIAYRLRTGLDYGVLMRHEHLNNISEIIKVIQYIFDIAEIKTYPCLGKHLSFYTYIEAKHPHIGVCKEVLNICGLNR